MRDYMVNNKALPLVSIIIPVYNGADFLKKAIDSALAQTYENIETIVVNDGSNDDGRTQSIIESYGNKIRFITKENGGVSSALNAGIKEMQGQFFSWLSHDDEYYPEKIEYQIKALLKQKNKKAVALCGTEFINVHSDVLKKKWKMPKDGIYNSEQALYYQLRNAFSGIALLIPREAFFECGEFDESLRYTQDANMWHRIFLNDYFLLVDTNPLARSRLHGGQQTNLHRERFVEETNRTALGFVQDLLDKHYYELMRFEWLQLLKNNIGKTTFDIEKLLIDSNLMNAKTKLRGTVYSFYGKVRPKLRKVYYKIVFNIDSKYSNKKGKAINDNCAN